MERSGVISLHGKSLTLVGPELKEGDKAPEFELRNSKLSKVTLAETSGKTRLFIVVPSLDTAVCDTEVRTFNEKIAGLGGGIATFVVSRDTAFAQQRFCGAANVGNMTALSDHIDGNFGKAWGLYIKENGLDARAIVVLDSEDTVRYVELVPALEQEPDYDAALNVVREVAGALSN